MLLKLKKINTLKLAFFFAVLYAVLSVFIIAPIGIIASLVVGGPFAWWTVVLFPIIYGLGGFLGGLIMGAFYNLVSKWIGGLEFDFEEIKKFTE